MKVVAIIQARMSSRRLPGKVMMKIAGVATIERIWRQLRHCKRVDEIVVATSSNQDDDELEMLCKSMGIECFRGELQDVLGRYAKAAQKYSADYIVRITGDCPVIDPDIVDRIIAECLQDRVDYSCLSGSFPDGLDCSVMSRQTLEVADREAVLMSDREHVCPFIERNQERFVQRRVELFAKSLDMGRHRWTLDEERDLEFLSLVLDGFDTEEKVVWQKIYQRIVDNPGWWAINSGIIRNEGYLRSLKDDEILD